MENLARLGRYRRRGSRCLTLEQIERYQPFFSIIIPTYGRAVQLTACLEALAHLDYPRDRFEVIVVDDGSQQPPMEVVTALSDRLVLTLVSQEHAGPATARNKGAGQAKGEFLAFTDDDCTPAPGWLRALAAHFAIAPDSALGGRTINAIPANRYTSASHLLIDYIYGYYNADPLQARFLASNNLAMPRKRFRGLGGFDVTFPLAAAEDRELCDRWQDQSYGMIYAPDAIVYHHHSLNIRTFWRQHFNYGRGAFHFHRAKAQRRHGHIQVEPLTFYYRLMQYPLARVQLWPALQLTALLGLAQIANAVGFGYARVANCRQLRRRCGASNEEKRHGESDSRAELQ